MCNRTLPPPTGCFQKSVFKAKSSDCLEIYLVNLNEAKKESDVSETSRHLEP